VAGVDVWVNNPVAPHEASGTSGMKAALNGVPSLSILDGWWVEGHVEGVTGWAIGADLGALGLGDDPERGNMDFLLTRPRSRAQLVWSGWFAGLSQLLPLLVLPLLASMGILAALTHALLPGNLLRLSVPLAAVAAAMYTLAFFMAAVARSARHGYELAALAVVLFFGYKVILEGEIGYWMVLSTRGAWETLQSAFDWYLSPHQLFPLANLSFVAALIVFLPYLAQLCIARRDF